MFRQDVETARLQHAAGNGVAEFVDDPGMVEFVLPCVVASELGADRGFETFFRRFSRDDVDNAAHRAGTVQRGSGPTHHLDALHGIEADGVPVEDIVPRRHNREAVHKYQDAPVDVVAAHTTDDHLILRARTIKGTCRIDGNARHRAHNVQHVVGGNLFDLFARHHGNVCRRFTKAVFRFGRCDDDRLHGRADGFLRKCALREQTQSPQQRGQTGSLLLHCSMSSS